MTVQVYETQEGGAGPGLMQSGHCKEHGTSDCPYSDALVAGIDRYPTK